MTEVEQKYYYRLSRMKKTEVDQFTLIEYLLKHKNDKKVVRDYHKVFYRIDLLSFFLDFIFWILISLFLFPTSQTFNFFNLPINTFANIIAGLIIGVIIHLVLGILFYRFFEIKLNKNGLEHLVKEAKYILERDRKGIILQEYSLFRLKPSYFKLEVDNLADWFYAQNLFEDESLFGYKKKS